MFLASFLRAVPCPGAPFPQPGPLGRVPRLPRYSEALRRPITHPAALRCLRWAVPALCSSFALAGPEHWTSREPGPLVPEVRAGPKQELIGPPRFLGTPFLCVCRALRPLSDPGRTSVPRPYGTSVLPPHNQTTTAPSTHKFRGSITRPSHSLCTLRSRGRPRATQHSVPVGG
jgi:hypothetical protein